MKEKNLHRLDCLYFGAFCKANNITKEDLIKLVEKNKILFSNFNKYDNEFRLNIQ